MADVGTVSDIGSTYAGNQVGATMSSINPIVAAVRARLRMLVPGDGCLTPEGRRQRRIRIRRIERNMHLEYLIPQLCGSRAYVRIHTLRPATRKRHFDRGRKRGFITLVVGWISVSAAVCGSPGRCAAARYELPRTAAWGGGQQLAFPDVNGRAAPCREATTFRSAVGP
jgi:hypothetical protein